MAQSKNRELVICAAILSAVEIMTTNLKDEPHEKACDWLRRQVTDAFTTNWNEVSVDQWLARLRSTTAEGLAPWD